MAIVESADKVRKNIKCIACALHKGEIATIGASIVNTKNFEISQDYEYPIPGFMILSSKRHVMSIKEFTPTERKELIELIYKTRVVMSDVLKVKHITIVQDEATKNSHFHVWLFLGSLG